MLKIFAGTIIANLLNLEAQIDTAEQQQLEDAKE